jgi:hypothetical protein
MREGAMKVWTVLMTLAVMGFLAFAVLVNDASLLAHG